MEIQNENLFLSSVTQFWLEPVLVFSFLSLQRRILCVYKQIHIYSSAHFAKVVTYFTCFDTLYFLEHSIVFKSYETGQDHLKKQGRKRGHRQGALQHFLTQFLSPLSFGPIHVELFKELLVFVRHLRKVCIFTFAFPLSYLSVVFICWKSDYY